jgi:hypothetical protein
LNSSAKNRTQVLIILLTDVADIPNRSAKSALIDPNLSFIKVKINSSLDESALFVPIFVGVTGFLFSSTQLSVC